MSLQGRVRKWASLGSQPAQSLHVGPLQGAERPLEHCFEALKGPVLSCHHTGSILAWRADQNSF